MIGKIVSERYKIVDKLGGGVCLLSRRYHFKS